MSNPVRMARGNKAPVGSKERHKLNSEQVIPVSLEQVLLRAARDEGFCEALIADRVTAFEDSGFTLRPSEVMILKAMPDQVLRTTIERLNPPKQRNQRFAKAVATAVAGSVLFAVSCDAVDGGVNPNWPEDDAGAGDDAGNDASNDAGDGGPPSGSGGDE